MRSEGNPLTLAGIEPATFRFVVQHLNHCATAVFTKYSAGNNIGEEVAQVPHQGKLKIYTHSCIWKIWKRKLMERPSLKGRLIRIKMGVKQTKCQGVNWILLARGRDQ